MLYLWGFCVRISLVKTEARVANGSGVRVRLLFLSNCNARMDGTSQETSYRLDVKISLGQKHTSMRKGKQAKRRFLLQRQEARSAALFG